MNQHALRQTTGAKTALDLCGRLDHVWLCASCGLESIDPELEARCPCYAR